MGRLSQMGKRALLIEAGTTRDVHRLWSSLRAESPPGVEEVVAGAATVLVVARPGTDLARLAQEVVARPLTLAVSRPGRDLTIPVSYDGTDLAGVAAVTGLTSEEVASRHSAGRYETAFVGFSPGFAYLIGLRPELQVPRLDTPRKSVPAGSVAIAGGMTAVYPQATPGGWRLIGRTRTRMFDPDRAEPSLLMPGDRVRFEPTSFEPAPPEPGHFEVDPATGARVTILAAGPDATLQDLGRPGWAHAGVPRAGALDRSAARYVNERVGNGPEAAVIESVWGGLRMRLSEPRLVCFSGARAEVTVDGIPARQDAALPLPAGSEIGIGRVIAGARLYIGIQGGFEPESVLGSRSTDTLSGLGPAPLADLESVSLGPLRPSRPTAPAPPVPRYPVAGDTVEVRAIAGPRDAWITSEARARLAGAEFVVDASSDRTGIRLRGPALERSGGGELPSEGMVAGAVQVPPDGQPIVLMRNHPTTGGYPVAAVVDDAGVDALAQAPPGVRIRFRLTPPDL